MKKEAGTGLLPFRLLPYIIFDSSCFIDRSEKLHFLFNSSFDRFCSRCKKLTWVISFTLLIFTLFNVFTCSFSKCKLALCIYIDLGNAKADRFLDHVCRDIFRECYRYQLPGS